MIAPSEIDAQAEPKAEGSVRDGARDSIFLAANICFPPAMTRQEARIRNISAGGMMIDFPQARPVGSIIHAEIKGVGEVSGTVAWSTAKRIGIRFDREIDPAAARYRPKPMQVPSARLPHTGRRPGLAVR